MNASTARTPRPTASGSVVAAKVFTNADIVTKSEALPNRWGIHAGQGFGKTSIAAFAPSPIFIQTRGETGLDTLISAGQLPETPHFPEAQTWADLVAQIRFLRDGEHSYRTLVLDTLNGAERMMHEFVCERDFDNDWTDKGFMGYMRGYEVALGDWRLFLNTLDDLRRHRGMTIFVLIHTKIKTFKNPSGPDYDRYAPEMHDKTWGLTKGWLDNVLFGNFEVLVKQGTKVLDASKKGKASESAARILYTNSDNPTFDAKNRLGLPDEIEMGDSAEQGWANLSKAIKESRKTAAKVEVA